jgi:hypothetical protein
MALSGWRGITVKTLAEKVGPVANLVVDEALTELGVAEQDVTAAHFVQLVRLLYEKLPANIDRRALCQTLHTAVLKAYGFGKT